MTSKKKDFYGKEVTDAIQQACEKLQLPQEQLDIEVIETGSTGIFGLIRKKAHIRVTEKKPETIAKTEKVEKQAAPKSSTQSSAAPENLEEKETKIEKSVPKTNGTDVVAQQPAPQAEKTVHPSQADDDDDEEMDGDDQTENGENLPDEVVNLVKTELLQVLNLMGYPSTVEVDVKGSAVLCHISEEHEAILTGQDGKTLDSIQYLLRKIIARKVPNRLRLTVDVGNYREKRLEELKKRAVELAEKVKDDGKTQVIAALSPSERRVVHMSLQEDKEIRSRSVGDGLFKKILIYKPGKAGKGGGRKRNNSRGRRAASNRKKNG